jgi:hypothetical protein
MMTILGGAACWIGFDRAAAAMGWAAGKKGVVFTAAVFESPDAAIRVQNPVCGREALLEAVSDLFEHDSEMV